MIYSIFRAILLFCAVIFYAVNSFGQSFLVNAGAENYSQGTCNTSQSTPWSTVNNISGIASLKNPYISFAAKKYYNEININNLYLSAIYPLKDFTVSALLSRHGNEYFNIQRHGVGIANSIGFVNLGLQVNYVQFHAEGFGTKGKLAFDFGGIARLGDKISFGAHIFNFTQSELDIDNGEPIPVITKAGITYIPIEKFSISTEVEKEVLSEPLFKIGLSYQILESLFLRTGATLNPVKNYFGLGYHGDKFLFDYGFSHHSVLGLTHQISFSLKIKKP